MLKLISHVVALYMLFTVINITTVNSLYMNEIFLYRNKTLSMPQSFNITFSRQITIPMSLKLNSMCQVPTSQLDNFNSRTNNKYVYSNKKRDTPFYCKTSRYCNNGGLAGIVGICLGSEHSNVDKSCIDDLWAATTAAIDKGIKLATDVARSYADASTSAAVKGINATLNAAMTELSTSFTSQITAQEQTLISALLGASSQITGATNQNIQSLSGAISSTLNSLQTASIKRMDKMADILATNIADSTLTTNSRISKLASFVDTFVTLYNSNSLTDQQNYLSIMSALQQLAISGERSSRFEIEGVDISPLLAQWETQDLSTVFQDDTNNTYNYVATGVVGIYNKEILDIAYPFEKDVIGRYAYKCYEKGPDPILQVPNTRLLVNIPSSINLQSIGFTQSSSFSVYDVVMKLTALCPVAILQKLEEVLNLESNGAAIYYENFFNTYNIYLYTFIGSITLNYYVFSVNLNRINITTCTYSPPSISNKSGFYNLSANVQDSGRYVILSDVSNNSILNNVTPDTLSAIFYRKTGLDVLSNIMLYKDSPAFRINVDNSYNSYIGTNYGNKHFAINHPLYGIMNIHRCEKLTSGPLIDVQFGSSQPFGMTDTLGRILSSYSNIVTSLGQLTIPSYGTVGTSLTLVVRQTDPNGVTIYNMEPEPYYYTSDIWCCDNATLTPVRTTNSTNFCNSSGLIICSSSYFGYCRNSFKVEERLLILSGKVYICPQNYNSVPLNISTKYKSPRLYYCSGDYKFREPYGVEISFCDKGEKRLPGAGVSIETGIMAPGGLYPAACIFWNSVRGKIPVYKIVAEFEDQIVPSLLNDLHGKSIAYYYGDGVVVDEMDRLYGIENSGYDCVSYEMEKLLHDPRNCVNFDIPTYNITAYFSGKVRSSGISKMLDYFDIMPILGNNSNELIMNFALRDGIDYEAAYVDNVNNCPSLSVSYQDSSCIISGWSLRQNSDLIVSVASVNVCDGKSSCTASIQVDNGAEIYVSITYKGEITNCSRFVCLSSSNTFLAYPVDTFSMLISRPNEHEYSPSLGNLSYIDDIARIISDLEKSIQDVKDDVNGWYVYNGTLYVNITMPDLSSVVESVKANYSEMLTKFQADMYSLKLNITKNINLTMEDIQKVLDAEYNKTQQLLEEYSKEHGKSEYYDSDDYIFSGSGGGFKLPNIAGTSLLLITLVLAILSMILHVYNFLCHNKRVAI